MEKKVLARNTAKLPAEGRGKAGQRRGQRAGGQEGQDGEGRGAGAEAGSRVPFASHSAPAERLLLKTQPPDIGLQESSPRSGVPACSVLMRRCVIFELARGLSTVTRQKGCVWLNKCADSAFHFLVALREDLGPQPEPLRAAGCFAKKETPACRPRTEWPVEALFSALVNFTPRPWMARFSLPSSSFLPFKPSVSGCSD